MLASGDWKGLRTMTEHPLMEHHGQATAFWEQAVEQREKAIHRSPVLQAIEAAVAANRTRS